MSAEKATASSKDRWSIDEVGQTTSTTVGPNFVKLLQKANEEAGEPSGPVHLLQGLRKVGFPSVAEELEPYSRAASRKAPLEDKHALWSRCAYNYTLPEHDYHLVDSAESGQIAGEPLYRAMNRAIRNDDPSLDSWAPFVGMLMYGGDRDDFEHYRNVLAPESVRPRSSQVTYRGFAMDPALASRYSKGRTFFWQAFVSTGKDKDIAIDFAMTSVTQGMMPFLFEITVPSYKELDFWVYDLETVSARDVTSQKQEVLLLPYTRFRSTADPTVDADGITHVLIEATDVPFVNVMNKLVVMVDSRGFASGTNWKLAKQAFLRSAPKFRESKEGKLQKRSWGEFREYGVLAGSLDGMGLFTDTSAAVKWMKSNLRKKPATMFLIVVCGDESVALVEEYEKSDTCNPCQILVFDSDAPRWVKQWAHCSHVRVTDDVQTAIAFCEPDKYDIRRDAFLPMTRYSQTYVRGCMENKTIYYAWQEIPHGISYAGAGSYSYYVEPGWNQAEGQLPDVTMLPFEGQRALTNECDVDRERTRGWYSRSLGRLAAMFCARGGCFIATRSR